MSKLKRDVIALVLICCNLITLIIVYFHPSNNITKKMTFVCIIIGILALITSISAFIYNLISNKYNKK